MEPGTAFDTQRPWGRRVGLILLWISLVAAGPSWTARRALAAAPPTSTSPAASEALLRSGQAVVGETVPWFSGWTPNDKIVNRTGLLGQEARGHALVFFATWCAPCEVGLEQLVRARERLAAAKLRIVLVAYRQEASLVGPWLRHRGFGSAPVLLDRFGKIALTFGAAQVRKGGETSSLPRTILFDRTGRVRAIVGREGADYVDRLIGALPKVERGGR